MPTTADLLAGTVMDAAASLLNDTAKQVYTYVAQVPYLNMALQELRELFELNEVPVTDTITSSPLALPANATSITFSSSPALPGDLIEPQILWQRLTGTDDPYLPVNKVDFLPRWMEGQSINQLLNFVWQSQEIRFLAANAALDIKIDYIRSIFNLAVDNTSAINVINAASFLEYRTAGLCAEFIGENPTRAQALNQDASIAMDRVLGIGAKGRQSIMTRRRPFRSAWKQRSFM